jgi:SAM-dependent methyltransferase
VGALPFASGTFALVFAQHLFLWVDDVDRALSEIRRVLTRGGVFVAIEPDLLGLIEHPAATAMGDTWAAGLRRAGGRPEAGRALALALARAGWKAEIEVAGQVSQPDPDRFALLLGLPLTGDERAAVDAARRASSEAPAIAHLPYFLVVARSG